MGSMNLQGCEGTARVLRGDCEGSYEFYRDTCPTTNFSWKNLEADLIKINQGTAGTLTVARSERIVLGGIRAGR